MQKLMCVYGQDRRAKKRTPAKGTKKYPVKFVGYTFVDGDKILLPPDRASNYYTLQELLTLRLYVLDEFETRWIESPEFT